LTKGVDAGHLEQANVAAASIGNTQSNWTDFAGAAKEKENPAGLDYREAVATMRRSAF
jgi:hypothetical protein